MFRKKTAVKELHRITLLNTCWNRYSSEHVTAEPDILFCEIRLQVCIFAMLCLTFIKIE